jgi:hypothetical protein
MRKHDRLYGVRPHQGLNVQIQQSMEADEHAGQRVFCPAAQFFVQLLDSRRRVVSGDGNGTRKDDASGGRSCFAGACG